MAYEVRKPADGRFDEERLRRESIRTIQQMRPLAWYPVAEAVLHREEAQLVELSAGLIRGAVRKALAGTGRIGVTAEDLHQESALYWLQIAPQFDPSRQWNTVGFFHQFVGRHLREYLNRKRGTAMEIPGVLLPKAYCAFRKKYGRKATGFDELVAAGLLSAEYADAVTRARGVATGAADGSDGRDVDAILADTVPDARTEDPAVLAVRADEVAHVVGAIERIAQEQPTVAAILRDHLGIQPDGTLLVEGKTLSSLAPELNLSISGVTAAYRRGLRLLWEQLTPQPATTVGPDADDATDRQPG
jgi:hypothetical protein